MDDEEEKGKGKVRSGQFGDVIGWSRRRMRTVQNRGLWYVCFRQAKKADDEVYVSISIQSINKGIDQKGG